MLEEQPTTEYTHGSDVFPHEIVTRQRVPAGRALAVMLLTLVLTLFLDADGLVRTAERQHLGWSRTAALAIMHPIQDVSQTFGLTLPRHWLAEATGHQDSTHITSTAGVKIASPTTTPQTVPGATTTTSTLPAYRVPTSSKPLRVLVAGDSLSGQLGPAMGDVLGGKPATVLTDEHVGTGLARPDVVDWPSELKFDMSHDHPEVVVLIFGGNDNQDLRTATGWVYISHWAEWKAEYQRRVAQIMNIVAQPGVTVFWVGMPVMNRADLQKIVPSVNHIVQTEAGARSGKVTYINPNRVLGDAQGSATPSTCRARAVAWSRSARATACTSPVRARRGSRGRCCRCSRPNGTSSTRRPPPRRRPTRHRPTRPPRRPPGPSSRSGSAAIPAFWVDLRSPRRPKIRPKTRRAGVSCRSGRGRASSCRRGRRTGRPARRARRAGPARRGARRRPRPRGRPARRSTAGAR